MTQKNDRERGVCVERQTDKQTDRQTDRDRAETDELWNIDMGVGGGGEEKTFGCKKNTVWLQRVSSSENITWKKPRQKLTKTLSFLILQIQ